MKKYFFVLCLFVLLLQIEKVQSQSFKFANTIDGKYAPYGIRRTSWQSATTVFKLDSTGNTVWVRDFSGYIVPSTYSNQLIGSAFDGKYLYVLEIQGVDNGSGPPHTYNPAIIKLDTLGNVLFIVNASVQPGGSYNVIDIFPSLTNGVWLLDDYAPGFTHYGNALYFDSLGQAGVNLGFWYGSVATMRELKILPDSNYIICVNHRPSGAGMGDSYPALTKIDVLGTILWRRDFIITGATFTDGLRELVMNTDSSGNIYLICDYYQNGISGVAGIKVSSSGNLLVSNLWTNLSGSNVNSLKFENNELVCSYNGTEIHFDTLLNNPCLNAQNLQLAQGNHFLGGSYTQQYSSTTFSPVNGAQLTYTPQILTDYCNAASSEEKESRTSILKIFPNPAESEINITTNFIGTCLLTITDLQGRICIKKNNWPGTKIDLNSLKRGVYFISLFYDDRSEYNKFVIR